MVKKSNNNTQKPFLERIKDKFRLVILNENTFEEQFSIRLSALNIFTWVAGIVILLIILITVSIVFTSLKELIPGYSDPLVKQQAINNTFVIDSLEEKLRTNKQYIENIKAIINGDISAEDLDVKTDSSVQYGDIKLTRSKEDSLLRAQIEKEEEYNLTYAVENEKTDNIGDILFFVPLKGLISSTFNASEEHYGIDIIAPKNEVIKSTLDGTVVLATWTEETGHILQIQHANNLISIYKHNSVLFKKVGDRVKAGDAIAVIGDSGELTSGPHLHFELWYNGKPIDPEKHMIF